MSQSSSSRGEGAFAGPLRPLLSAVLWLGLIAAVFLVIRFGKGFFIPLVLSVLLFYLVTNLDRFWGKIRLGPLRIPSVLRTLLSVALIVWMTVAFSRVVADNAVKVTAKAPEYQMRISKVYEAAVAEMPEKLVTPLTEAWNKIEVGKILGSIAGGMVGLIGNGALVFLYLFFQLLERQFFEPKLRALFPDEKRRESVYRILSRIDQDVRRYLGVKTVASFLVALLSYLVMRYVGLDFAEFWALLLFTLNFIPNIGSFIATVLPSALALAQFVTPEHLFPYQFFVVAFGISAVQLLVGNLIEPPLIGKALNLSPFVVILSLVLWARWWGITGMFLCVPIMVVFVIILSNFPQTRWIAVLLSRSGDLKPVDWEGDGHVKDNGP